VVRVELDVAQRERRRDQVEHRRAWECGHHFIFLNIV
jgi:hypothetical protein